MSSDPDEIKNQPVAKQGLIAYTCPGELYSITHSIHLARLAAFYSKCRECEHRFDAAHLFPRRTDGAAEVERRVTRTSLILGECVRGIYLNELDRNRALAWGEAFAASLWDEQPMMARRALPDDAQIVHDEDAKPDSTMASGPIVVVGYDERPSSPDIVSGIVLGLRRMGCSVTDLGQTSLPIVAFQIQALDANAGLFVTGAGGDASLTGFSFLARGAQPLRADVLTRIERDAKTGVGRQTRQIGRHIPFQGQASYESSLVSHFHALRPLKVVCGSSTRLIPRLLDRIFHKLPCTLTHVPLPHRKRSLFDSHDVDLQRVARSVVEGQHHLGLVIDEDGQHVAFVTDRGRLVLPRQVARILIEIALRENQSARFVIATSLVSDASDWLQGRDATAIDGGETAESLVRQFVEQDAMFAFASDGLVWFDSQQPACDALLVLARILQGLSLSDAPFSEVVSRIGQESEK